jgi:hypothetical protein
MVLSACRRRAVKRGAFAVAIAIVFVALLAAPQVFHTSTRPSAPAAKIADVTETSPGPSADVGMTRPRPSALSTSVVAGGGHSLDALAIDRGSDLDLSEISDVYSWLVQIPGTSDQDLFSGSDGLLAGDQLIDVPETPVARYYPSGPWAGGFAVGSRRGSDADGGTAGDGGAPGLNTHGNSSQFNPSSSGGNNGDGGTGNNNGGNGNGNTDQPNDTNLHGNEHSQGALDSSSGDNPSDRPGAGPSNDSSEKPISVPEPSTLLLAGFGLSGLIVSRRLTHRAR